MHKRSAQQNIAHHGGSGARQAVQQQSGEPSPGLSVEHSTQPNKHASLSPAKCLTDVMGGRRGAQGLAEMAIADDPVQLVIGQFEKPLRLAVTVIFQPGCAEDWIRESN